MIEICRTLDWDSQFFGIDIAEIAEPRLSEGQAKEAMDWCASRGVRCLYWLVDPQDSTSIDVATSQGFRFADVRMSFAIKSSAAQSLKPSVASMSSRVASQEDCPALALIADESHRDTRFYYDPHFDRGKCHELYRTWICNSVAGFADTVLIITKGQDIAGYVTCKKTKNAGRIDLLAVEQAHRGQGVGRQLIWLALNYFSDVQADHVEVSTSIRNLAAQRLYVSSGFLPSDNRVWYHRWFESRP